MNKNLIFALLLCPALCPGISHAAPAMTNDDLDLNLGLPPLPYLSDTKLVLTPKERTALELAKAFRDRNVSPVMTDNGRVTYAYGLTTPSVICAPFQVTDIELQPGEFVNDVALGDTARWKMTLARSGSPETSHLIVKPLDAGLETTAVITTDRRVYHLQFRSQTKEHMGYVGFVYPEEAENALRQQIAAQRQEKTWKTVKVPALESSGSVDLSKLDFNWSVTGNAKWKPVQVFSDGRQTFIRLPQSVKQAEMPVLLLRQNGGDVLANYRVKDDTLVVDEIFTEAVLLAGVGRSQERVTIRRAGVR